MLGEILDSNINIGLTPPAHTYTKSIRNYISTPPPPPNKSTLLISPSPSLSLDWYIYVYVANCTDINNRVFCRPYLRCITPPPHTHTHTTRSF